MSKRHVGFLTLIKLIREKGPIGFVGIVFTFSAIFLMLPFVLTMVAMQEQPYQKYDREKIIAKGVEKTAEVYKIDTIYNVSYNGQNPKEISYRYQHNGETKTDKFQTLNLDTAVLKRDRPIKISTLDGQSVIKDLEPFVFPFYLFYGFPVVFGLIGIIFLLIGLVPALKIYNLYKNGLVKEAFIISLMPVAGKPVTNAGRKIWVNYYYNGLYGNKILGESGTSDFSILINKKVGDTIKVFVSETDENRSCMAPDDVAIKNKWQL